jgi:DNA-directed RNA polymerase specialized sigma24 family protein
MELYTELVGKYSKAYHKKMQDLFDIEDIAQEIWVTLLSEEEKGGYKGRNNASERTYLAICIRNHMLNIITREITTKRTVELGLSTTDEDDFSEEESSPEDSVVSQEQLDMLSGGLKSIKHGNFIFEKTVEGHTVREISYIAKQQGIKLSKSGVNRIQHKIKQLTEQFFVDR